MNSQKGAGVLEIIVASGAAIAVLAGVTSGMTSLSKSSQKIESSMDLAAIKAKVVDSVSCSKTFAAAPSCATTASYVALKNKLGNDVVATNGTQIGKFLLRAKCNPGASGGIEVRAAKLSTVGMNQPNARDFDFSNPDPEWFQKDEVNKQLPYNWAHPKGQILSSVAGNDMRICKEFFAGNVASGALTCPNANQIMRGFNPVDNSLICVDIATIMPPPASTTTAPPTASVGTIGCLNGQYLQGFQNGAPVCKTLPSGTITTVVNSPPPSSPSYQWRVQSDNYDCYLNTAATPIPTCSSNVSAGVGCSTLNSRCRSTWVSSGCSDACGTGTCRRLFKCY